MEITLGKSTATPWLALFALSAVGCATPDGRFEAKHARVLARTAIEARDLGRRTDRIIVSLLETIPDAHVPGIEVIVDERARWGVGIAAHGVLSSTSDGTTVSAKVYLHPEDVDHDATLAHELVHALLGRSWRALPPLLEEGLCDVLALRFDARELETRVASYFAVTSLLTNVTVEVFFTRAVDGHLPGSTELELRYRGDWSPESAWHSSVRELHATTGARDASYGLGYYLVREIIGRHGIDRLHALAKTGSEPARVFELAGVSNPPDWVAFFGRVAEAPGLERLEYAIAHLLVDAVIRDHGRPDISGTEFLTEHGARFRIVGSEQSIPFGVLPDTRETLEEKWPRP